MLPGQPTLGARRDAIRLVLAAACWGLGTVVSKRAVGEIDPFVLLAVQLASSLVVLVVLMRIRGIPFVGGAGSRVLGRLGVLNPGLAYGLGLVGLASITASLSVMIWAFEPLLILLLAVIVLGERIGPAIVGLTVVAIAGMTLILYDPASSGQWSGILLTFAGVVCCAVYTVVARRWIRTSDSTAQVVLAQQVHALAFATVLLVMAAAVRGGLAADASVLGWLSAVGSGILYYAAAYWFYLGALRGVPASIAAFSFYLIPVFGVLGSLVLLGEHLGAVQWLGVALVMTAVVAIGLVQVRRPRSAAGSAIPVAAAGSGSALRPE